MTTITAKGIGKARWRSVESARKKIKDGQIYLLRRHGGFFRPGAHGYTADLWSAGLFGPDEARGYLDAEGVSATPLADYRDRVVKDIADRCAEIAALTKLIERMGE